MEIFCKYLDRAEFEIFAVSRIHRVKKIPAIRVALSSLLGIKSAKGKRQLWASMNARVANFQSLLGSDHVRFARDDRDLHRILLELHPDILHVHYSGAPEPPTSDEEIMSKIPVVVTTNQFERHNTSPAHRFVKRIFFVSNWLLTNRATWAKDDARADVLYNPIEVPCSTESLRANLGIPASAFVIGRVGRPDPGIHDPISLRAFRQIEDPNTYFLALSPPENMIRQAKSLNLRNFIALPSSTDEIFLSKFYNTLDVLAHARRDGETFGCNIAEAMIHGKPVVSHISTQMNAQSEVIGDAGYVVALDDWQAYAAKLELLKKDRVMRGTLAARAQARALEQFEARNLTKKLQRIYLELLKG